MPATDLLERYLAAIRLNLYPRKSDDIIAELRDVLLSEREEKEARLGRPLTPAEDEALIQDFGHPLVVAARYGRQQYLIGPEVYPFYIFVLKLVAAVIAGVLVTVGFASLVFGGGDAGPVLARVADGLWSGLIGAVGALTIMFAVLDRSGAAAAQMRRWRPSRLPRMPEKTSRRFERVAELTWGVIFLLWWTGVIHVPEIMRVNGGPILHARFAPIWAQVYWLVVGAVGLRMACDLIALARPNWIRTRTSLNVLAAAASLSLAVIVYRAGHWVDFTATGIPAVQLAALQRAADLGFRIAIIVVGAIWILQAARELWRAHRAWRQG